MAGHLPDILEAVKMALRSLRTNLFRTVLTLLGIIIGVGAVVAMLAIGDGSKASVLARIEAMGTDLLVVRPGARNVRAPGESSSLVPQDADAIATLPNVRESVPEYGSGVTLRYQESDYTTTGTGTTANYARARTWEMAEGAFFSDADVTSFAPVIVLGRTGCLTTSLWTANGPSGKFVLVTTSPSRSLAYWLRRAQPRLVRTWTTILSCRSPRHACGCSGVVTCARSPCRWTMSSTAARRRPRSRIC